MVIQQTTRLLNKDFIYEISKNTYKVDLKSLENDIELLEVIESNPVGNKDKIKEITKVKRSLMSLHSKTNKETSTTQLSLWADENDLMFSTPMRILKEYSIYFHKYLTYVYHDASRRNKHTKDKNLTMVYIDLTELANYLAFELMKFDLEESRQDIERKITNTKLISVNNGKEYFDFTSESPYLLSKFLKIEKSDYVAEELIEDYFDIEDFVKERYKEPVSFSCKYAMMIILENLYNKLNTMRIVSVYETGICILVDINDKKTINELKEDIIVKILNRKFRVDYIVDIL